MFVTPKTSDTGTARFSITKSGGAGEQKINGSAALPAGAWTHVAVTLSGSTGTLYVNGAAVGTNGSMTLMPSSLGATTLNYIGRSQFSGDPYLNGAVDDFQIHARALSASEIAALAAPPGTPTGIHALVGGAQITLNWNAVTGATGYNIKRATASGGPYAQVATGVRDITYTNSGLTNGTTYYYIVTAANGVAEGAASSEVSAIPNVLPAAPSGLVAIAGNATIGVSWSASAGAASYNIKRSLTSGTSFATIGTSGTTGYSDALVSNGTTYYYAVSATNSAGEGMDSTEVSARPTAPITAQEKQSPPIMLSGSNTTITVKASVVGHTYQLQYCDELSSAAWRNSGAARTGDGTDIEFTAPADDSVLRRYYRISIQQ
jgi:fibronectin type 3 domain-containing protein